MRHHLRFAVGALALSGVVANASIAPATEPSPGTPDVSGPPSPEALRIASDIVARTMSNSAAQLRAMARPLVQTIQIGRAITPERAEVMVDEVVMPLLREHLDTLSAGMARAYASGLDVADLKALDAFYASPTGLRLIAAQPKLAAAQFDETNLLLKSLVPEVAARTGAVMQAHGWAVQPSTAPATHPATTSPPMVPPHAP